jgi:hypothetical protein
LNREFRLAPPGSGRGLSCDANGAFIGAIPLLKRSGDDGPGHWEPRDCVGLSQQLGREFGLPIDMSSKMGGLNAISSALNRGDLARAQIATVLLGIPEPPTPSSGDVSCDDFIKFIRSLGWSGLIKADWDPDEHPRWPAGAPDSQGGQFAPKGENDDCNRTVTNRRRWERHYGKDWPKDTKTGRYQDVAHIRARADGGSDDPENIRPLPHDEHVREHMERGDYGRWARRRGKGTTTAVPPPETAPTPQGTGSPAQPPAPTQTPTPEEQITPDQIPLEDLPIIPE